MIRFLTKTAVVVFLTPAVFSGEKAKELKAFFCVQRSPEDWISQKYPPLLNPKSGTTYVEFWATGKMVERAKLRIVKRNHDVMFEYHFGADERLKSLNASLHNWGYWVAERDLPISEGIQPTSLIHYYRSRAQTDAEVRETMNNPEEKGRYLDELDTAPVWTTAQAVPCAGKLT